MTPAQAASALAELPIRDLLTAEVASAAARIADAVRDNLSEAPGGPHDQPWNETGALRDSITVVADGLSAQVASSDPAAAPQEFGTSVVPPRPFLAPPAASLAEPIAQGIGHALADLIGSRLRGA